jgi:hypothetical protein
VVRGRYCRAEEVVAVEVLVRRSRRRVPVVLVKLVGVMVFVRWLRCGKAMVVIRGVVQGPVEGCGG